MLAARAVKARKRTFALTVASYLEMAADMAGQKIAKVTVARPLDQARTDRLPFIFHRLGSVRAWSRVRPGPHWPEAQLGGPVSLQVAVDPAVLGGMSITIDDDVIESTVAGRLEQARRQLINL